MRTNTVSSPRRVRLFCWLLSYVLVATTSAPSAATASAPSKAKKPARAAVAPARPRGSDAARREGELLVRFREGVTEEAKGLAVNSRGVRRKKKLRGEGRLERVELGSGEDAALAAEALRLDPSVELAEPNFIITRSQHAPDDERFSEQWALLNTGQSGGQPGADVSAPAAWRTTTGDSSAVVAVIDSGVDFTHPDLRDNRWSNRRERSDGRDDDRNGFADDLHGWDWVADTGEITDAQGHGTAVAGVIAARGNNGAGTSGVMWRASVMSLRVLDAAGAGDVADAVEAIDYAVAHGAQVINCSWGTDGESQILRDAIARAGARGVVVVASAGNAGRDVDASPYYPASFNLPNLISVAATDKFDNLAPWSNWGASSVAVTAPGTDILTTKMGGGYWMVSGTSVSAPLVTGIAGLVKTVRPWLDAAQTRQAILDGARRSPFLEGKVRAGGVASASGALEKVAELSPDTPHVRRGGHGGQGNGNRGREKPPAGSGGRGRGGGFDASKPPPTTQGGAPQMPNLDEIRNEQSYVPRASSSGRIMSAGLPPVCDGCYEAPGEDPEFSTSRALPANETGEPQVDLGSRNFNWSLPLVSLPGRAGLDLGLTLYYNSLVWTKQDASIQFNADNGFPGPGFRLGFPTIQKRFRDGETVPSLYAYMMVTPSGGRVKLRQLSGSTYESLDGSYTQMTDLGAGGALVRTSDGTRYTFTNVTGGEKRCTEIKDRNGNFITIGYNAAGRPAYVRDTLERVVNFNYDSDGNLASLTQARTAHGLTDTLVEFTPGSFFVQPNYPGLNVLGPNGANVSLLRSVKLPDGTRHVFDYTPFGQVYKITRLAADGHARSYEGYNVAGSPWAAMSAQSDCPRFTERRDWVEWGVRWQSVEMVTRYSVDPTAAKAWTEVTLPDGRTKQKEYFATAGWRKGLTERVETIYDGVVKKWTTLQWMQDDDTLDYQRNPRVTQTEVGDAEGNLRRTVVNYVTQSGVSLPREVLEYAKMSGNIVLVRRATTDYRWDAAYLDRRIIGLVDRVQAYDGAGALVSKTTYGYDWDFSGDLFTDTPAAAKQHDRTSYGPSFVYGRGNLSVATRYDVTDTDDPQDTWQETKWRHNSTGSVVMERDHLWHATYLDYTDSFSDNSNRNTFAYPTRFTDEDGYQSTTKYNYATAAVTQSTRPSSGTAAAANVTYATTDTAYDFFGRVESVAVQNGLSTRFVYPQSQTYVQTFTKVVAGQPEAYTFTHFDGAGRPFTEAGDHPGSTGGYSASWVKYDELGRAVEYSNPTEINVATGAPTGDDAATGVVWTLQAYDWQGRPTVTTNPDGSTTELTYAGCGCAGGEAVTARDERGRRRKLYNDGMGRLAKVEELNWNQSVYATTSYTYNGRDQLTRINQGGQLRTLEYDGHGRLFRRTTPEQGVTTYAYHRDDTLAVVTDARGATATYGYNNRHLPTSITYGIPSGVAATPNVTFEYDAAGSRTLMTDGQGHVTYAYDTLSRLSSETRHFTALGQSYALTYSYNLAGQLTSYTDYRGSQVRYGHDHTGRVTSVTGAGPQSAASYGHGALYRAFGALKYMSYGNGRALAVAYDNRLRVKGWDVATIIGFDYSYSSEFYQEKTGRVIYARSLYDQTLDRSYEYDHVGRLVVAHAGAEARAHVGMPAGSGWNQMDGPYSHGYEYDVRGNLLRRYGWGGLLGGVPGSYNEQVKAYDANNRQTDLAHDASGNVINETSQVFTYDAEGQQASALTYFGLAVNGWYDGDRLRVRKQDGGATTLYVRSSVLGGAVVAELTGAGAWQRGYVYGGGGEVIAIRTPEGMRWVHQDPATKTQRLTDSSGAITAAVDLDPWGGETARSWNSQQQPRKYTTYERDSNADDEAMMRRYSRRHGRFSQPDPYDGSYDLTDPQSLNRYSYVSNDPVNFTDPTGLVQDPNDPGGPPPDDGPPDVVIPSWAGRFDPFFFGLDGPFGVRGIRRPITEFEPRKADGPRRDLGQNNDTKAINAALSACTTGASIGQYSNVNPSGTMWKGRNGQWYRMAWGGNGSAGGRTAAVARSGASQSLGKKIFYVGAAFNAYQGTQAAREGNYAGAGKAGLDIGMGAVGAFGGLPGAVISGGYFVGDMIGWDKIFGFMDRNRCITSPIIVPVIRR